MLIIEISALENGAHRNQSISGTFLTIPEGWAIIPDDMEIPEAFPFVDLTVEDDVVTSMTAGVVPESKPEPEPEPSQLDRMEAQVAYTAMMTDTLLPEVTSNES